MISFKNIFMTPLLILIAITFSTCNESKPVQNEPTDQTEIDSELIGTWRGLGPLPKTVVFEQDNQSAGSGVKITEDLNGYCENVGANYLSRVDFKWTQTKKVNEGWSSFYYKQTSNLECGGAEERMPLVSFERYYNIEGDTLYLGTEDYQTYVRVK